MGREVRRVPADWQHPKDQRGRYIPLLDGYNARLAEFEAMHKEKGLQEAIDYFGSAPDKNDYMPDWPKSERTHYMMYEDTSEGTPISPVFATPEELAHWLADNRASSFGNMTSSYESWLRVCKGGYAPSAVFIPGEGMKSGVDMD